MAVQLQRKLFTIDEYQQMIQAGVFHEDDRLELIEGEIAEMSPISPKHAGCVNRLADLFYDRLRRRAIIAVQNPVRVNQRSEPQPDVALLRPRPTYYGNLHPAPEDVLLIVEVSDTSADYDRDVKMPMYAKAGIPEAWLVSLADGWMEVYREPSPVGYKSIRRVLPGETVSPLAFPDVSLDVSEITE
ncbi:MAG TPA: Uma2 family endonuclease [Anaerolineae bacterium]|nr:Uma2 family endonuclease [Anaerolineae bacterium]